MAKSATASKKERETRLAQLARELFAQPAETTPAQDAKASTSQRKRSAR